MSSGVLAEPILVGRQKELRDLESFLSSATEGKGKTVFISGEAGAGKTRLVTEFLNRAKMQDVITLTGWCLSNAAVPYFPFFEAFNAYMSIEHGEPGTKNLEIKNLLIGPIQAENTGKPQAVSAQVWKDQTFIAVTQTLTAISTKKPIILLLEDIHWADSASLALIHYIARAINFSKLLVLATYRSEALATDSEGHPHPLTEILRQMRRDDLYNEIKLPNLNQDSVYAIGKSMLGGSLQPDLAEKLTKESQGNPLYIVETLRMLHEQDSLSKEGAQWRLSATELGIPAKIKDIILQRLSILARNQRRVLDAASVIGERFSVQLLAGVLGQDTLELAETLESIAEATSLVCCGEELYSFDHAKSRDAIYEEISPVLKRGYHGKIAEKLEATSKVDKLPFSELAYHYGQAGSEEKAVKYALAAGEDELARWSNEEAITHFTYVVQTLGASCEQAEERFIAIEGLGDALLAKNLFKESTRVFEELANLTENDAVRLRAFRKAMECAFQLGDSSYLMELVKKAEPYAQADRLEYARVLIARGRAFHLRAMLMEATKDMDSALPVLEEEYSLWDIALVLIGLGSYHGILGKLKEGMAESLRSIAMFEELGDFRSQMEACWVTNINFHSNWLLPEAEELLSRIIRIEDKTKMGDYLHLLYAYGYLSRIARRTGDLKAALAFDLKGLEIVEKTDAPVPRGVIFCNLVISYACLGDLKLAEQYLEKLSELPKEVFNHPVVNGRFAMAVFFAAKGEFERAYGFFNDYFELGKAAGIPGLPSIPNTGDFPGFELYAWILQKQGRLEEAKVIVESAEKDQKEKEARFEHADLQAHLTVRKLVIVGDEFEMRFDLVNVGRKPLLMEKIANIPLHGFEIISPPPSCEMRNEDIEMTNKEIGAFQVDTTKLGLVALKVGTFPFKPQAIYVDDMGETKNVNLNPVTITVQPAIHVLPGRVSSGFGELDDLLGGGIPDKYTIILSSPSSDEREMLINRFLEAGAEAGETVLYITGEAGKTRNLAKHFRTNFYLLVCNPQADLVVQDLSNVFKLKGIENLIDIDIALTKLFRTLDPTQTLPKRACITFLSDVLLRHHAVTSRKWLSSVLENLKAKGFTTLAVIDQNMHPAEEVQAITGLFDGEIRITEKEATNGVVKILRIRKLTNQQYSEQELVLTKEKLSLQLKKSPA